MRKVLLAYSAVACLMTVAAPHAHAETPNTSTAFEESYSRNVNEAVRQGDHIERKCWSGYCSDMLLAKYSDGVVLVARNIYDNGRATRQVCSTPANTPNDRNCWFSYGAVILEHFDGTTWQTVKTLFTAFADDTAGASM